jgi:HEAT repeat protein
MPRSASRSATNGCSRVPALLLFILGKEQGDSVMRGSCALVLLFALASADFAPALAQPKFDPKKDPVAADTTKVGDKTLEQCIKDFGHKDVSKREAAIRYILLFPPETAAKAIPALTKEFIKSTPSGDLSVRASICTAMAEIFRSYDKIDPVVARNAAEAIRQALHDPQVVMRFRSAQTLASIGPEARAAIPELIVRLKDQASWEIRQASAQALGMIAHDKQSGSNLTVLQALYQELSDPAFQVRLASVQSLTYLGPPADQAGANSYIKSMDSVFRSDPEVPMQIWARCAVAYATQKFDEETLAPIGKLMKSTDPVVRTQALQAMGTLGPKGQKTLNQIIPCLSDPDGMAKLTAIWAVGQMGGSSLMAVPKLQQIIADPKEDPTAKLLAKQSLEKINGK